MQPPFHHNFWDYNMFGINKSSSDSAFLWLQGELAAIRRGVEDLTSSQATTKERVEGLRVDVSRIEKEIANNEKNSSSEIQKIKTDVAAISAKIVVKESSWNGPKMLFFTIPVLSALATLSMLLYDRFVQ